MMRLYLISLTRFIRSISAKDATIGVDSERKGKLQRFAYLSMHVPTCPQVVRTKHMACLFWAKSGRGQRTRMSHNDFLASVWFAYSYQTELSPTLKLSTSVHGTVLGVH
jgi:hypothetical protein